MLRRYRATRSVGASDLRLPTINLLTQNGERRKSCPPSWPRSTISVSSSYLRRSRPVGDISDRLQCPPDYVAVTALTALGSLIGRRIGIKPQQKTDWLEVPNIWGAFIGKPGMLKSPAMMEALKPLHYQVYDQGGAKRRSPGAGRWTRRAEAGPVSHQ